MKKQSIIVIATILLVVGSLFAYVGGGNQAPSGVSSTCESCHSNTAPTGSGIISETVFGGNCYTSNTNLYMFQAWSESKPIGTSTWVGDSTKTSMGFSVSVEDVYGNPLGSNGYVFDVNCAGGLAKDFYQGSYAESQMAKPLTRYTPAVLPVLTINGAACGISWYSTPTTYFGDVHVVVRAVLADGDHTAANDFTLIDTLVLQYCGPLNLPEVLSDEVPLLYKEPIEHQAKYFTLYGQEISYPTGLYILKQNGQFKLKYHD
jgi:hypothetical protein